MPKKRKSSKEAVDEWAKGINKADKDGKWEDGVSDAAKDGSWEDGVKAAGDESWGAGVAKAKDNKRWSKGVKKNPNAWGDAVTKVGAGKTWADATKASKSKFQTAIGKVIDAAGKCADDVTPRAIEKLVKDMADINMPITAGEAKGIIARMCLADQRGELSGD